MPEEKKNKHPLYRYGILLFLIFYFFAAALYPGGNAFNTTATGFSWRYNYWCNLLNETAINGSPNPGARFAKAGMFVLSLSLSLFFISAPSRLQLKDALKLLIRFTGIAAMVTALLLGSSLPHDWITNLASGLGLIAMGGLLVGIYRNRLWVFFWWALFNLVLVAVNNWLYLDPDLILYLPVVQKISFASFLLWMLFFP